MSRLCQSVADSARLGLLAAGLILPAAGFGCDDADRDTAAREKLMKAYALRTAGDPDRQFVTLADEVAQSQSTDATLAQAHQLVGDVSLEVAGYVISGRGREPEPGLGALQTRAIVLAEQANRLAAALAMSRSVVETEQRKDPSQILQSVDERLGAIRAGEGWTPAADVQSQLPALEQTQQRIDELNARLEELNQQIGEQDQQRQQMLAQASELDQLSDQQTGQQSVDTYRQVADLRTEAAEVSAGIERLQAQLRQTTAEVQEAMALRDALEETIQTLQTQQEALRQKWGAVQEQIQQIQQASQETYATESAADQVNPLSSVEMVGQELGATLSRMNELRTEADGLLNKASTAYSNAGTRAGAAVNQASPQFRQAFSDAFNTGRITLARGAALRQLGSVHAGSAAAYAAILELQRTLAESGRELPQAVLDALPASPEESYTQAVQTAAQSYTQANDLLAGVSGGGRGAASNAAITHRAGVLAALWSLHGLVETTGVQVSVELPSLRDLQTQARELAAAAQTARTPLPAAAPFVGVADLGPTTEPTTEPGEEPATQPADDQTTQPAEEGAAEGAEGEAPDGAASDEPQGDMPSGGDEPPPDDTPDGA